MTFISTSPGSAVQPLSYFWKFEVERGNNFPIRRLAYSFTWQVLELMKPQSSCDWKCAGKSLRKVFTWPYHLYSNHHPTSTLWENPSFEWSCLHHKSWQRHVQGRWKLTNWRKLEYRLWLSDVPSLFKQWGVRIASSLWTTPLDTTAIKEQTHSLQLFPSPLPPLKKTKRAKAVRGTLSFLDTLT